MKLLDSTFLIDLLKNKEGAYKKLDDFKKEPALFVTMVNVFELVSGIYSISPKNNEKRLNELLKFFAAFEILDLCLDSAIKAGEIHGKLRSNGKEIDVGDSLIAGISLTNKVDTIITKNKKHFERIEGLKVEDY